VRFLGCVKDEFVIVFLAMPPELAFYGVHESSAA